MTKLLKDQIKALCKLHGISVRKFEQEVGVADKTVAHIDMNSPSIEKVVKFADFFGVSVDSLIGRESAMPEDETSLIAKYRRLTPSQQETILNNIDFLLSQNPVKKETAM